VDCRALLLAKTLHSTTHPHLFSNLHRIQPALEKPSPPPLAPHPQLTPQPLPATCCLALLPTPLPLPATCCLALLPTPPPLPATCCLALLPTPPPLPATCCLALLPTPLPLPATCCLALLPTPPPLPATCCLALLPTPLPLPLPATCARYLLPQPIAEHSTPAATHWLCCLNNSATTFSLLTIRHSNRHAKSLVFKKIPVYGELSQHASNENRDNVVIAFTIETVML